MAQIPLPAGPPASGAAVASGTSASGTAVASDPTDASGPPVGRTAPVFLPCGDRALSVQFGDAVDPATSDRVIALAARLRETAIDGVTEVVPTYRALLVRYDPLRIRGRALEARLRAMLGDAAPVAGRLWRVPALYGGAAGQDLPALAAAAGLSVQGVVDLHAGAEYRVYMLGFAPGFAYLGGLPLVLHSPRLPVPRQLVPAGALGIGGQQASINSVPGPSGWRYVGWTPVRLFDPSRDPPVLLQAGDRVRFIPIGEGEAAALAARAAAGDPLIAPVPA